MYSELHCKTNYSFLTGGSHADELVDRAVQLGYRALAITDENTLAGVVRAFGATREATANSHPGLPQGLEIKGPGIHAPEPSNHSDSSGKTGAPFSSASPDSSLENKTKKLKLIIGAEIVPNDAPPVLLWATDRKSYGNLSRLITIGRRRAPKGECWLSVDDIANHAEGLLAGVIPYLRGDRLRTDHMDPTHPSFEWHFSSVEHGISLGETSLIRGANGHAPGHAPGHLSIGQTSDDSIPEDRSARPTVTRLFC